MAVNKWQKGTVQLPQRVNPGEQQNLPIESLGESIEYPLFFFSVTAIDLEHTKEGSSYTITSSNTDDSANINVQAGPHTTINSLTISWMCIGQ